MQRLLSAALAASMLFVAAAHAAPATKAPALPAPDPVHLTDNEGRIVLWFLKTYGGEHCGIDDASAQYCEGAVGAREVFAKIQQQIAAAERPPVPPAPAKK